MPFITHHLFHAVKLFISDSETIKASLALSTDVISVLGLIVRFVNISAFLARFPFSSNISREESRQ